MIQRDALIDRLRSILPTPVEVVKVSLEEQVGKGRYVGQRLVGGDPGEVVVDVLDEGVVVSVFGVVWEGPHTPTIKGEPLERIAWRDLPPKVEDAIAVLGRVVERARQLRVASFKPCEECGETKPPEWMHDEALCQGCAQEHHGVVY